MKSVLSVRIRSHAVHKQNNCVEMGRATHESEKMGSLGLPKGRQKGQQFRKGVHVWLEYATSPMRSHMAGSEGELCLPSGASKPQNGCRVVVHGFARVKCSHRTIVNQVWPQSKTTKRQNTVGSFPSFGLWSNAWS